MFRWKDNITMKLRGGMEEPVVGCCEHNNEPSFSKIGGKLSSFSRTLLHGVSFSCVKCNE